MREVQIWMQQRKCLGNNSWPIKGLAHAKGISKAVLGDSCRVLTRIKKSFEDLIAKLCECYTRGEYEWISGALQDICDRNDILHWWEWWEA